MFRTYRRSHCFCFRAALFWLVTWWGDSWICGNGICRTGKWRSSTRANVCIYACCFCPMLSLGVNAVDHTVAPIPSNNTRITLNAYVCSPRLSTAHSCKFQSPMMRPFSQDYNFRSNWLAFYIGEPTLVIYSTGLNRLYSFSKLGDRRRSCSAASFYVCRYYLRQDMNYIDISSNH